MVSVTPDTSAFAPEPSTETVVPFNNSAYFFESSSLILP
jgi:hypothetical protein